MTVNEGIISLEGFNRGRQVRVIGAGGEQLGMMSVGNALDKAYDHGLDLVLIAPQSDPPVCRMMDYGKYRFERDKREKEARKKQQTAEVKEIQLTCLIDTNDFNTKVNHALKFLSSGNKVKVVVRFRGRQMSRTEVGAELLERFIKACSEKGTSEKAPVLEGRTLMATIAPIKQIPVKEKAAKAVSENAAEQK